MEVKLVVVRISMSASDVLNDIHGVLVQINIVFLILVRTGLHCTHKFVVVIVRDGHSAFHLENNVVGTRVIDRDPALCFKVVSLLGNVPIDLIRFGSATQNHTAHEHHHTCKDTNNTIFHS